MARKPQSESVTRPVARKRASGQSGSRPKTSQGTSKRKPLKELSPDYVKRLRAAAKREGITVRELRKRGVGAARGHAVPTGLTESRVRKLRREIEPFARQQAARFPGTDDDTVASIVAALNGKIREHGIGYLARLQAEVARMNAEYMGQTKRDKRGRRPSVGYNLDILAETWELPPETFGYH